METLTSTLETIVLANRLRDWLLAALIFCAPFVIVPLVRGRIRARLQARGDAPRHDSPMLELFLLLAARTSRLVLLSIALYFAEKQLVLPPQVTRLLDIIIVFGLAVQAALWGIAALRFLIERHYGKVRGRDENSRASVSVLLFVGQMVIWAVFMLLALDNLGVNITALVAGLGIGGIAIALAVQTVLGDLLASMSIALDKPFVVGDHLRIDDVEGRVEYIGIKSTRLRAFTGEQIILANADALRSRVRNMGRMAERRVLFRLRFPYDTPPADLARIPGMVEEVVKGVSDTRFVSCLFAEIGAYALEYEVIYYISNLPGRIPAANDAVNRGIMERLGAAGLALAYPVQRNLS